nr:AarF/UbiB family protein [Geodermatophilus sp. DSM 45219]
MVHEQLVRAFGTSWRQVLEDFDDRPVAAASVGQVHRATWSDGTPVAVKVQYPGAGETLVADLGMLEKLAPVVSAAAPGLDARQLLAELRARLVEELDHVREAAAQTAFADAYRGDPDIPVPDVLAAEDRVLVTRWVGGTPLSRVIATGTRADRDRAGQLLLRLLASASVRARRPAPRQLLAAARRPARRPRLRRDRGPAARLAGPARPAARRRPGRRRLGPAPDRRLRRTAAPGPGHRRRPARPARPLPAAAAHPGPPVHPGLAAGADPARLRPVRRGRAHPAPADRPAAPPAAAARGQRTGRRPLLPRRHRRRRRRGPALVARPRPDSTVPTPTVSRCADR